MTETKEIPEFAVSLLLIHMATKSDELTAQQQWDLCTNLVHGFKPSELQSPLREWCLKTLMNGLTELSANFTKQ